MNLVVDASVIIKWFALEEDSAAAEQLLEGNDILVAPAHALAEVGQVLVKLLRAGRLSQDAFDIASSAVSGSFLTISLARLFDTALRIAVEVRRSVYDALYIAAAERWDTQVVTADEKLVNGLSGTPWQDRALLLKTWAEAKNGTEARSRA